MAAGVVSPPFLAGPLRLHPFRARMLQPSRIGDPSSARLFGRPYRAVAGRLQQWEDRGRITLDERAGVYLHEFTDGEVTVRGLVGALDLTRRASAPDDRVVRPHEGIHPAQADELADRMDEMQLQPAPILLVHRGSDELRRLVDSVARTAPARQFADHSGQRHRLWALRTQDDLLRLDAAVGSSRAVVADGHHRYAAYLRVQARRPGTAADRGLAMLVDQNDTPLQLGPIHRVLEGTSLGDLQTAALAAGIGFEFRPTPCQHEVAANTIVATDGRGWASLQVPPHPGRAVVELLHDDIVPALPRGPRRIVHHHVAADAVAAVARRRGTAVLLPAPAFDEVARTVASGRLLPEKTTSFQPKPSVGVLMRALSDE